MKEFSLIIQLNSNFLLAFDGLHSFLLNPECFFNYYFTVLTNILLPFKRMLLNMESPFWFAIYNRRGNIFIAGFLVSYMQGRIQPLRLVGLNLK